MLGRVCCRPMTRLALRICGEYLSRGANDFYMNVLFINRSYWPDAEATGQLLTELCEDLAKDENLSVSIICGQPNFNLDELEFQKYGESVRNRVTIHRVRHSQFDKSTFWGRVTNFITFLIVATWKALWVKRPDVIVVETDPPLLCLLGFVVSKIRRTKLVCYLQDIYPDIAIKLGRLKDGLFTRMLRWSFLFAYRNSDQVVVVGDDMRKWLINHLVRPDRIRVIENWVDTDRVYPFGKQANPFRDDNHLSGKFVLMYSGNLGYTQRFDLVLDAAEHFRQEQEIVFVFVGNGVKRSELSEEIIKRRLPNTRLIDYQPKAKLALSLSAADVHFVLLDSNLTELMMPSKIYSALASGTAVLGIGRGSSRLGEKALPSHLAETIEGNEAGFFIDESEPEKLIDMITFLYENPGELDVLSNNARSAAVEKYSRKIAVRGFRALFADMGHVASPELAKKKDKPVEPLQAPEFIASSKIHDQKTA